MKSFGKALNLPVLAANEENQLTMTAGWLTSGGVVVMKEAGVIGVMAYWLPSSMKFDIAASHRLSMAGGLAGGGSARRILRLTRRKRLLWRQYHGAAALRPLAAKTGNHCG